MPKADRVGNGPGSLWDDRRRLRKELAFPGFIWYRDRVIRERSV